MSRNADVPAKRELTLAVAFFAAMAVLIVAVLRPLDTTELVCLLLSIAFVVAGCWALWTRSRPVVDEPGAVPIARAPEGPSAAEPEELISAEQAGEPSPQELTVLASALEALVEADALAWGEVDPLLMWRAAQHADPGCRVGSREALYALSTLHDFGLFVPRRLVFMPSHTEYDAPLLASLTASVLRALGHETSPEAVTVRLPAGGGQGRATITFPLADREATVECEYLWKYPPSDLSSALIPLGRADDPRELVGADIDYGTLLLASVRPGSLEALNRRFPEEYPLFGPP